MIFKHVMTVQTLLILSLVLVLHFLMLKIHINRHAVKKVIIPKNVLHHSKIKYHAVSHLVQKIVQFIILIVQKLVLRIVDHQDKMERLL